MFCVPAETSPDAWVINTWLMSCRVLGRTLERFMLDRAIEAAREAGIARIIGVYRPTAKNALVSDLFDQLAFTRLDDDGAEERRYELEVSGAQTPYSTLITQASVLVALRVE